QAGLEEQFKKITEASKAASAEAKNFVDRLKEQAATLGKTRAEAETYRASQQTLTGAQREGVDASIAQIAAHDRMQQTLVMVGTGAQLFKLLGNEIYEAARQGSSLEELLPMIADKFSQFADGVNKTELARALLGRAGERLIPLLNQGASGFAAAAREAKEFGA